MRSPSSLIKSFALISLFAAIAVGPMLFRGIPGGNDAIQHYEFAQHLVDVVNSGDLFPHFAGNANHGFGDVGLRIYPPLAYYAMATGYFVFGEWYSASLAAFFIIFLIGGIGVFLWAREFFDPVSSIASAAVYTFAPFHLNEIYNNFLYAEFAAGAVLPFCFLFATRAARDGDCRSYLLFSISHALLVLTHLPLTIIGSLALGMYILVLLGFSRPERYLYFGCSILAAAILSSFYWIRMLTEMQWVKHSQPEYFANIWSFEENFLLSARTFSNFLDDGLSLWFGDIILVVTLVVCIPAFFALRRPFEFRSTTRLLTSLIVTAALFATPVSYFVWRNLPLLEKVQFPWRWLNILSLAAAVLAGAGTVAIFRTLRSTNNNFVAIGTAAAILPFVFVSAFVVRAPHFTPRAEFEYRLRAISYGETFEGWWPIWAKRGSFSNKARISVEGRGVDVAEWQPTKRAFKLEAGEEQTVEIATFYYPHWRLFIDGREFEASAGPNGLISFRVPAETVRVDLAFVEPPKVVASSWAAFGGWLAVVGYFVFVIFRRIKSYGTYS